MSDVYWHLEWNIGITINSYLGVLSIILSVGIGCKSAYIDAWPFERFHRCIPVAPRGLVSHPIWLYPSRSSFPLEFFTSNSHSNANCLRSLLVCSLSARRDFNRSFEGVARIVSKRFLPISHLLWRHLPTRQTHVRGVPLVGHLLRVRIILVWLNVSILHCYICNLACTSLTHVLDISNTSDRTSSKPHFLCDLFDGLNLHFETDYISLDWRFAHINSKNFPSVSMSTNRISFTHFESGN